MIGFPWDSFANTILTIVGFSLGLLVKFLLDIYFAPILVRYLSFLPVNWLFGRERPDLRGDWRHQWETTSPDFPVAYTEASSVMYQLGPYCYSEFVSKHEDYVFFGRIKNVYLVGDWYDRNDKYAYFGTFELHIRNSNNLEGLYIGHSAKGSGVQQGKWSWTKRS